MRFSRLITSLRFLEKQTPTRSLLSYSTPPLLSQCSVNTLYRFHSGFWNDSTATVRFLLTEIFHQTFVSKFSVKTVLLMVKHCQRQKERKSNIFHPSKQWTKFRQTFGNSHHIRSLGKRARCKQAPDKTKKHKQSPREARVYSTRKA